MMIERFLNVEFVDFIFSHRKMREAGSFKIAEIKSLRFFFRE